MSKRKITRSKRNPFMAGIALLSVLLFTSCAEEEPLGPSVPPGNSLYVASAIIAPAPRTETEVNTRVAGDDVPVTVTAGSLGIFRSKGTGYTEALNNKKYTYMSADLGWQPATAADTLFLNGDDAEVCAYYPYNSDATYSDATIIPIYSGKYIGTNALHDPNDLCYDINRTVNAARRVTTFEMKHALSLLEFRISKEAGYQGDCRITSITVMNPEMITGSAIDITTGTYSTTFVKGTITYNPGADADGILVESAAVTTGTLLVPFTPTSEGLTLAFTVNDTPVEAVISATDIAKLEAGHRYSVKVTMKANSMQVTGVDMIPWDEVGVGGDDYTWYPVEEVEKEPIDIGLDFLVAPGNLRKMPNGSYAFAQEQGYSSGVVGSAYSANGGDYFCWNTLNPNETVEQTAWDDSRDPCRQVKGGEWYTPTSDQLQKLADLYTNGKAVWGTYTMKQGSAKEGMYFGTTTAPATTSTQDDYVFLPAAFYRKHDTGIITDGALPYKGYYWSSTDWADGGAQNQYGFKFKEDQVERGTTHLTFMNTGMPIRCVKDKPLHVIDIGLDFYVADGNLQAISDGAGGYTYQFADEQGYYSGGADGTAYDPSGGDYFCWNTLDPSALGAIQNSWDDARDVCRKIGDGKWYTPTKTQWDLILTKGHISSTYSMQDGSTKNGIYLGTTTVPTKANQDKYVFLPAAGFSGVPQSGGSTQIWMAVGSASYYWSATATDDNTGIYADCQQGATTSMLPRFYSVPIRCVRDK